MMLCQRKEPNLDEMMRDPIIQAVMACDSVREAELRHLLERMRRRIEPSRERAEAP